MKPTPLASRGSASWRELRQEAVGLAPAQVATKVLRRVHVDRAPVDVVSLARQMGAAVFADKNMGSVLGGLDSTLETPTIWVNANDHPKRQRFSIAHEIGHLLLHPLGQLLRDESFAPTDKPQEIEANEFASHLLMPLWLLEPLINRTPRPSIETLGQMFEVSLPAMRWQLAKLI